MEGGGKGREEKGMLAEFRHVFFCLKEGGDFHGDFMDGGKGERGKGGKRT